MTTHVNSHANSTSNSSSSDEPDLHFDPATHEATTNGIDEQPEVASLVSGKKAGMVDKNVVTPALSGPDNSMATRKAK